MLRLVSAVAINLGRDGVEPFLTDILKPIHRELEVPSSFKGIFGFAQFFLFLVLLNCWPLASSAEHRNTVQEVASSIPR